MIKYQCIEVKNEKDKRMFLNFPSVIYKGDYCPQDYKTEKELLNKKHPLSPDISFYPYIVIDYRNRIVARCAMTYYKGDNTAYIGFFEAYNDLCAVKILFDKMEKKASLDGKTKLLGPIDASIYIRYRFKTDNFNRTYTGEPYNKDYYPPLWRKCGFQISDEYVSNQMRRIFEKDNDKKLQKVYSRYTQKGYKFISPNTENFSEHLENVYFSLMKLYSGFSGYKPLTKEQFMKMYSPIKKLLNFEMVKLVYKENKLYAFCIAIPNYEKIFKSKGIITKLIRFCKIKKHPEEYVILYVGAEPSAAGLGCALIHHIRNILYKNKCTSIGALIKEGNITGRAYDNLQTGQFHYVLLTKDISQ